MKINCCCLLFSILLAYVTAVGAHCLQAQNQQISVAAIAQQPAIVLAYDSVYYYSWDTVASKWKLPHQKEVVTRDAHNNVVKRELKRPNGLGWEIVHRYTYTYDDNNNMLTETQEAIENNVLINYSKEVVSYDAKQNVSKRIFHEWAGTPLDWVAVSQHTCTYDANNNRIDSVLQFWDGGSWINRTKYIKSYDTYNNLLIFGSHNWIKNAWDSITRYSYTYDSKNNRTKEIYISREAGKPWRNEHQRIYNYDANNDMVYRLLQRWENNTWKDAIQLFFTYDANHNNLTYKAQFWSSTANNWDPIRTYYKATYTNDNKRESEKTTATFGTITYTDSTYYHSHKKTNTISNLKQGVKGIWIYPNPSSGKFTVELSTKSKSASLIVYTLTGEVVGHKENTGEVDLSFLPKGIYLIKIDDGRKIYNQRIVLQ